jgi:uncharacterized DUF497 family protein
MFEFDPAKSAANRGKPGIDFEEVQAVWSDTRRLEVPADTRGEARWALVGRIGVNHWTVIFTGATSVSDRPPPAGPARRRWPAMKKVSTEEFDRAFDAGEDITPHLDFDRATRPGLAARRVNVDFPAWMVEGLAPAPPTSASPARR